MVAQPRLLLRAAALAATLGAAQAQCDSLASVAAKINVAGYDYTGLSEGSLADATFEVTGIKCSDGYATVTGSSDATVVSCGALDTGAYTVSGCEPCASGVGLCTEASSVPNQVNGDQIYYQDTGVTSTEINWQAPNSGTYSSPILGYKIEMKILCTGDVAGTLVSDADGGTIDYQQDAVYDCAYNYETGFSEPVSATPSVTSAGEWVEVTGVYTPLSGQNHGATCHSTCATTSCSAWATDADILHVDTGCSGCAPQNPETDVGCFPGAAGYPTTVGTLHAIGGLVSNRHYTFRIAAFNHFGTGPWSTQAYAVHMHTVPTAPTWAAAPVTSVVAAGTGFTLTWAAGDAYGTGTDDCAGRGAEHTMTATLSCSRSKADIFADCDTSHDGTISDAEFGDAGCPCISSASGGRTVDLVTYAVESCSTAGYGANDAGSATASGAHTYTIQQCTGVGCTPTTTTYTPSSTTQVVSGLTPATTYVFKVTATNTAGSTSSVTTSYTTPTVPDKPDPPVALEILEGSIKVSWLASIDKILSTVDGHDTVGATGNSGFILYAQSYDTASASWVPAVRGSLTHDGEDIIAANEYSLGRAASATNPDVAYGSDSDSTTLDGYLQLAYFSSAFYRTAAGAETSTLNVATWNHRGLTNRVDVIDTVVVPSLLSGTQYRFKVALKNAAGTSELSDVSLSYTTPDAEISSLRIYSGPPCVYKPSQGGATTFAASSTGTGVKYRWELVAESNTGQSVLYSDDTMDPGGSTIGTCMDGTDCSVIEYTLPYPGDDSTDERAYDQLKIRVLASNGRGIVTEEISFGYNTVGRTLLAGDQHINSIDYCGCTDPGDDNYWSEATFMVPSLCTTDTFDSSDAGSVGSSNVAANDWEYFQFFFDADSYAAEVTVRVDVGTVDVYVSTVEIPDAALPHTYSKSQTGVSNFYVADLSYANLVDSAQRSVFVAVKGSAGFSRFQVMGRSSEFSLAPGSTSPAAASRERLQDITTVPAGITKTVIANGFNFFEMYYPHAENDIDLQLIISSTTADTTAKINVYASMEERYPGPNRATADSSGYWTGTGHFKEGISSSTSEADGTLTFTIRPNSHSGADGVLYIGVTGVTPSSGWAVGDDLPSSTYTIKAKVYRYNIESSLLDPIADATVTSVVTDSTFTGSFASNLVLPSTASAVSDFYNGMVVTAAGGDWNRDCIAPDGGTGCDAGDNQPESTCLADTDDAGTACTSLALAETRTITDYAGDSKTIVVNEAFSTTLTSSVTFSIVLTGTDGAARTVDAEDRYSVVSTDNFNYYEIITSDSTKSLSLSLTVHYGKVAVYTSSTSLPTQDETVSQRYGTTYSASSTANTIAISASATNIGGKYVYLGIFASDGGDASYDLVVTENTFGVAAPTQLFWCEEGSDVRSYTTSTVAADAACTTLPGAIYPVCDDNGASSTVACPLCTDELATLTGTFTADLTLAASAVDGNQRPLSAVTDYYVGMVITNSNDNGESRVITGYNGATWVITVSSAFTSDTTNGVWMINAGVCEPETCKCTAGDAMGLDQTTTITDNDGAGHFFALYVGNEDVDHQTAYRTGMGSLPSSIDGSESGWGLDWTMPMTNTWIDSKTDEWDMDIDFSFPSDALQTGAAQGFRVFASTRERYPSDERAYDTAVASAAVHSQATSMYSQAGLAGKGFATTGTGACALLQAESTLATYGLCLAACDTLAGTQTGQLAEDANGVVTLPAGVATSDNYYAGWTIVTTVPAGVGTILTSLKSSATDTTPIITISWLPAGSSVVAGGATQTGSSTIPDVDSSTLYTLYPPSTSTSSCNAAQFTATGTVCQLFNCPANAASYLVADETDDQAYRKSSDATSLIVPHYTFSSSWVYFNIEADNALTGHLKITKTEKTSSRSVSIDPSVATTGCTSAFCNYNGNCIDDSTDGEHPAPYCVCSDGYSGADCSIEAFSTATTIATSSNILGTVATGYEYASSKSGGGAACTDMTGLTHNGCMRITNAFSAALTLKDGINHATTLNYYAGWNIILSGDTYGEGVIATSSAADPPVITVTWSTAPTPTTTTSTTYTIWTSVEKGTMSAANTLQASNLHSTAVDYYSGYTIATTANPQGGSGTVTSNTAAGVLTVAWTSLDYATGSTTTYTLTPPTQCNTQNEWQANGAANAQQDFVSADATLGHALASAASTVDDYYNGMSVTIVAGAGLSEESGIFGAVVGFTLTLQASQSHWANDANYYTGFAISVCSAACDGTNLVGSGTVATSTAADPPVLTVTWSSTQPTVVATTSGYTLTHPGYTITDYVGSTKRILTAPALPTTAFDGATFPTTSYVINTCSTGNSWNEASKTCTRYSGAYEHVWEPFVYIGIGNLQHCAAIENLVAADNNVDNCRALCSPGSESGTVSSATQLQTGNGHSAAINFYVGWTIVTGSPVGTGNPVTIGTGDVTARGTITGSLADLTIAVTWDGTTPTMATGVTTYTLTPPASACNAFMHDSTNLECKLYTCPTATAPVTTEAETKTGSWGVDATAAKKAYHRSPLTCCADAATADWKTAPTCSNPVSGYYDEASCTSVQGVTTAGVCEQVAAGDKSTCENAPATTVEATCELTPYDEVPASLCSPEAIRNGYDGSTTAKSCDAFDVVKLDCATQKCTPSASGANPYRIGYVTCPGGVCTINAAKPIVEVPFTVAGLPQYAKVLTYVDSQPYPAKGANTMRYTYNCESSDADCVANGIHTKATCTETATVSVAATRTLCEAVTGGTKAQCVAIAGCTYTAETAASTPFAESSVKIYDMAPLPAGKKHTLVMMLLTDDGEPLGTVLKQFEVGYAGGCAVAPDGSVCGGNGACYLGYCVCYDGYFGTTCERNVDEDGSVCAAKSSSSSAACLAADGDGATPGFGNYQCNWDAATSLCSIQVVTTGFTAGAVYQARATSIAANKLGEARFLNTRMLEATAAAITKSDSAITAGTTGTKTKLETVAASVVATVAASKTATQTNVDALYAKTERNAIKVRQAKEESLRLQTTNLEAKLEMQRSLADHQTEVQNRFQTKRFDVYKLNALKQDKLKQEFARTRFTLNQLLTSNGPTVDPTQFKESTCTTDQFYNVICSETTSDKSSSYAGTGYVSGQTVDTASTDGTRASPVVAIEGEDQAGYYNDASQASNNRGR
jgi:hypothetical protein